MPSKNQTQILKPIIRLLVTKGNDQGKVYECNHYPVIVGRDEGADFKLAGDNNISRKHARISIDERGAVWIEDLGSTNGSFVNNIRITAPTELEDGSTIIVGSTWLKFIIFKPGSQEKSPGMSAGDDESSTFFAETKKTEAILILDLHDSSRLTNMYGDEVAMQITETLNEIALPIFNTYGSEFCKGTGDGFLVTFRKPQDSLSAALDILKKVQARYNKNKKAAEMHIRISLNFGQCHIEPNGDRHGNAVNTAFRVEGVKYRDMKKSKGAVSSKDFPEYDRIFVTEDFISQLSPQKRKAFSFIGNFRLKGIKGLHPVYSCS